MQRDEKIRFGELITAVFAFYRQPVSDFAINVWWQAMQPFDFAAVADALNRHCIDPDRGQFAPKPADVVRLLQGGSKDSAAIAWANVIKAVRMIGTYESVDFGDPVIHACISDLGGWVAIGQTEEAELPHLARRFEVLHQGYRLRGGAPAAPNYLVGLAESQNSQRGFETAKPVMIGDGGSVKALSAIKRVGVI